jgi:hypothetical protein
MLHMSRLRHLIQDRQNQSDIENDIIDMSDCRHTDVVTDVALLDYCPLDSVVAKHSTLGTVSTTVLQMQRDTTITKDIAIQCFKAVVVATNQVNHQSINTPEVPNVICPLRYMRSRTLAASESVIYFASFFQS